MDLFGIHKAIVDDYSQYINSFIDIKDDRINEKVSSELKSGKLWPEPLLQFNPSFEPGDTIINLCHSGLLNPQLELLFKGYKLYRHQIEALELGIKGQSFIVTSGTGSGKSLTYIGTIFNYLFSVPQTKGIKALIVYPMNALINSQTKEIQKYKENYERNSGKEFPFTFEQYTGQEKSDIRDKIKKDPPDLLLTNYMMLELILTRLNESTLKQSIANNLKFLVFDELHTYRGRQGADVAMLIRRIHALSINKLTCIGTSATMVTGSSIIEQKEKVAEVASSIFSVSFTPRQIINEKLIKSLSPQNEVFPIPGLKDSIAADYSNFSYEDLLKDALAKWLEAEIALELNDDLLIRRTPITLREINGILSESIKLEYSECEKSILSLLSRINEINNNLPSGKKPILPFKLNQFISQTGSVYVTLESKEKRTITLEPKSFIIDKDNNKKPLYPIVFSRFTGFEFICVRKNCNQNKLEPREFNQRIAEEDEENFEYGYILIEDNDEVLWDEGEIENFPDAWIKRNKNGTVSVASKYVKRIPQKIYFNEQGNFSESKNSFNLSGWYISSPLLFDPTCGMFYDIKTSEGTKLAKLGVEGRSTATTVLSFSILNALKNNKLDSEEQKLLSFTDNRQDAALQAGHFNDFIKVGRLRSGIYNALKNAPDKQLDYSIIAQALVKALDLKQEQYAVQSSTLPFQAKENEDAFKAIVTYRLLYDLRRGWRVILPNLEQCGLLKISYKYLKETVEVESFWKDIPLLANLSANELEEFLLQFLNYFRSNFALSYDLLKPDEIDRRSTIIRNKIKPDWGLDTDEEIDLPSYMRVEPVNFINKILYTNSIGAQSYLGKYIKDFAKRKNYDISKEYKDFVYLVLNKLEEAGFLSSIEIKNGGTPIKLYQLKVDTILWQLGNGMDTVPDKVRLRAYKNIHPKINEFFQNYYKNNFENFTSLEAKEHTAQINNEDRQIREDKFRAGEIKLLCCSPTMELGIDISTLNVVHLRNVPPNPSNYAQRAGRAGRSGQGALLFTFCSNYSSHDQHYFRNQKQMVSGVVAPPRIDLSNEELLKSHLYAIYLSEVGIAAINDSIGDLLNLEDRLALSMKEEVKEKLNISSEQKEYVISVFRKAISSVIFRLQEQKWYTDNWIRRNLDNAPIAFDRALDRWRDLYKQAHNQLINAQEIIKDPLRTKDSNEKRAAFVAEKQAVIQKELLLNKNGNSGNQLSEFYPYRYLAAEGFLPGYNFTRLPLRVFVPKGEDGQYISRARFLGLREFGPGNIIYHDGSKYKINQLLLNDADNKIQKIKVSKSTGYALLNDKYDLEYCPFSNEHLATDNDRDLFTDMIPMADSKAISTERINCEEEERLNLGYEIATYFTVDGGFERIKTVNVMDGEDQLLKIKYIPAATLIKINKKWRSRLDPGFPINIKTGFWKKEVAKTKDNETRNISEEVNTKRVRLFTTNISDALYIYPMKSLAFKSGSESDAIVTFQYAIKKAIENVFQVESNEIGVEIMGTPAWPNIIIYEAAEGSLGVLSQIVEDSATFSKIIQETYQLCYFENGIDTKPDVGPASYGDLLSYYNQFDHLRIDRHLIKEQLEKLLICRFEVVANSKFKDYEEQYQYLLKNMDANSSTERKFLDYLYKNGLKLPDIAQYDVPGLYIMPDFYYEKENACVFCDGTPHDEPEIKKQDKQKREALINKGYDVVVYYYKDSLEELVKSRSDIFTKVR